MALSQRLQIRQSQALVMTPQLMQAIKLLQLSNLDLVAYVEAELERNPLLDQSVEDGPAEAETNGASSPDGPPADGESWNANGAEPNGSTIEERLDTRVEDVFPDDAEPPRPRTPKVPPDIRNGPPSAPAVTMTANTILKRSSPPRPHWPTGCANSSRSPSAIRGGG